MKKINFKILIVTCIVCLLPIFLGVIYYNELPKQVAIHFNIEGNPDNYFPKSIVVFALPVFMMLIQAFCCIVTDISDNYKEANKKASNVFKWIIPCITVIIYAVTIFFALGYILDIRRIVMILTGLIFIITGNYIPKTKGNTYIHIGNITDEKVLYKISKITGYIMILNGILFIVSILFNPIVSLFLVILTILEAIIIAIYAYVNNKNSKANIILLISGILILSLICIGLIKYHESFLFMEDGTIQDAHYELINHLNSIENNLDRKKQIDYSLNHNLITIEEANELY